MLQNLAFYNDSDQNQGQRGRLKIMGTNNKPIA